MEKYVHGYSQKESKRLNAQAATLEEIIHNDSIFKKGSRILEAGCGTGAQTTIMAKKNPDCFFTSIDISDDSLKKAEQSLRYCKVKNVELMKADINKLDFINKKFDYIVLCFVLEHLRDVNSALSKLKKLLKKNGEIMIIEGDHGSTYFFPDSKFAKQTINCQVELQRRNGGNANIGRELFLILSSNNFKKINVTPRMIYVDPEKPELVRGFTENTFIHMIEGVKKEALANKLISLKDWENGIKDLYKTKKGIFCYTFFKAWAQI